MMLQALCCNSQEDQELGVHTPLMDAYLVSNANKGKFQCNDPLNSCSGVTPLEVDTSEYSDGRRDQALDGPVQAGIGP